MKDAAESSYPVRVVSARRSTHATISDGDIYVSKITGCLHQCCARRKGSGQIILASLGDRL